MKNATKLFLFIVIMTNYVVAMNVEKKAIDLRKMGLHLPCNAQDEGGNTFWHNLAHGSENFKDWNSLEKEINDITDSYIGGYIKGPLLLNVFITNSMGRTARKEAKIVFNKSYNPVTAAYILYLKGMEKVIINASADKEMSDIFGL